MLNQIGYALHGAWQVLLIGVVLGAGLPMIFALGIRSLAIGSGGAAEVDHAAPKPAAKVLAGICFAVVIVAVLIGIEYLVGTGLGYQLSFAHVVPTLTKK